MFIASRTTEPGSAVDHGTLTFGSVTIERRPVSDEDRRVALQASLDAVAGLAEALRRPGIRLEPEPGVPLFRADPDNPDRLLRELDGKTEKGTIEGGVFRPD